MDRLLHEGLRRFIRRGNLRVTNAVGTPFEFGDGSSPPVAARYTCQIYFARLPLHPELRLGEAVNGDLLIGQGSIADLVGVVSQDPKERVPFFAASSGVEVRPKALRSVRSSAASASQCRASLRPPPILAAPDRRHVRACPRRPFWRIRPPMRSCTDGVPDPAGQARRYLRR